MSEQKPEEEPVHEEAAFILNKAHDLVRTMLAATDEEIKAQIQAANQKGQEVRVLTKAHSSREIGQFKSLFHTFSLRIVWWLWLSPSRSSPKAPFIVL